MKTIKIILLALLISIGLNTMAQVAINTDGTTPDASAMLEIKSTEKGFLTPRMTQAQIEAISNPADGLIVYNTTDSHFYFYNDGAGEWKEIAIGTGTITPPWTCGDAFVDARDSQTYTTVQIGTQCWMAENLNYETPNSWWYLYNDGDIYGRLYRWEAALTACPSDWSLPSDDEWKQMEMYLGMSQAQADATNMRGSDEGGKLKETGTSHWNSPNTGATNSSGFTALPGGDRASDGGYAALGYSAYLWSSTEYSGTHAWHWLMRYNNNQIERNDHDKMRGNGVRCLKN